MGKRFDFSTVLGNVKEATELVKAVVEDSVKQLNIPTKADFERRYKVISKDVESTIKTVKKDVEKTIKDLARKYEREVKSVSSKYSNEIKKEIKGEFQKVQSLFKEVKKSIPVVKPQPKKKTTKKKVAQKKEATTKKKTTGKKKVAKKEVSSR